MPNLDTGTSTGAVLATVSQLGSRDFWRRLVTDPFAAVRLEPELAVKSGVVAGATVLATGVAIKTGAVAAVRSLFSGLFGAARGTVTAGRAAAPLAGFVARHPLLTYVTVANANLPTETVRALGAFGAQGGQPGVTTPQIQVPGVSAPPARIQAVPGQPFSGMFSW